MKFRQLLMFKYPSRDSEWVYVRGSEIHGKGVFALNDIPRGTKIIQYTGKKVLKRDSDARFERDERNKTHYMFELNNHYYIDGLDNGSDAIYINHACQTNCEIVIENNEIWIVAKKKIKKGNELHYDYGFDYEVAKDHLCLCGKPNCRGYIVDKSQYSKLKKLLGE